MASLYLFDFSYEASAMGWRGINDTVMGGTSQGAGIWDPDGFLSFMGHVSLENGGGFASISSPEFRPPKSSPTAIEIDARGDEKIYKLAVRTDTGMDGISYQARFTAPGDEWRIYRFPVEAFVPTWHGTRLEEPTPDLGRMRRIGLIIADRQSGPFRLDVRLIRAVWEGPTGG